MKDLVVCYSVAGRYEVALKLNEELLTIQAAVLGPKHRDTVSGFYNQACLHSLMISKSQEEEKEADLAMAWLRKAVAAGYHDLAQLNRV
jgi:hypothetical protein